VLNEKQKLFCRLLLKYKWDRIKAYTEAYPNCSEESARREASRLLTNVDIYEYMEVLGKEIANRDIITVQEVLEGIKEDIKDAKEVKQYSAALKGRELLGKYLKMFTDRIEANVTGDIHINWGKLKKNGN
jgi:phage terminase small subunit